MVSRGADRGSGTDATTTVAGTEEARAFFQARLAIFGLALFVLSGLAWTALLVAYFFAGPVARPPGLGPFSPGAILHLLGVLQVGALWLATRRGRRSPAVLHTLDIGITFGMIVSFAAAGGVQTVPMAGGFIAILSFIIGSLTRAIVVPSTARRTLLIGLTAGVAVVAFAAWRLQGAATPLVFRVVPPACWTLSGIVVGVLASHTIFGLRRQVDEARVLGQYRLESKIGEGGMGEVWRASHALLRRPTAIKLLPPDRMGEAAIRRFEREVQLTARLTHPNTVAIYDYGRTRDGIFYYAMELIDGTNLETLVARHGAQPAARVVHVLAQVCGALAEAHDLGLVHRDIKPANVLVSPRKGEHEFAKLLDFGLVKAIETSAEPIGITGTNTITGTPLYMSPEAIRAPGSVDARSDLYSLGVVAWFLLVGRPPFGGHNVLEVCSQHLSTPPARPSSALGRAIPADVEDAVLACLAKQQDERPPDARALRDRLLSTGAAGRWTVDDAAAWWRDRTPAPSSTATAEPAHARTIALDVSGRASMADAPTHRARRT
ncbi:MAG TPA: serine/threonine-protein kinase [Kofleriaceae bacterium]|nr:serine/threonine-protein kinase [Kofleriaceae bacterium]